MPTLKTNRRTFLKTAGLGLAALPLASSMPMLAAAPADNAVATKTGVHLDVRSLGAVGDGKTKDTLAFQQALDRCAMLGGGEVFVAAGTYLIGAIAIGSNTVLRLHEEATLQGSPDLADYPLTQVRWEGRFVRGYIGLVSARNAENVGIAGGGKIVGNTEIKGRVDHATGVRHPALLEFAACKNVLVQDCVTQQNDMWSIHPLYCENLRFQNLTVNGGADGIDVDSCKHVVIDNCRFDTGDDCISLKSGRGEEGYTLNHPTEDVRISNCSFVDHNWACIGIGSETSAGIRNVRVEHCQCLGAKTFAIYIKSRPGRGAFIEDISMDDLDVSGARLGFLRVNILNSGKQDEFPVPGDEGIPTIRNFRFNNIRVKDVPVLVDAVAIHPGKPLDGFSLTQVSGTCGKGIALANINHAVLRDIAVSGFSGPLLSISNVSGTGLEGAAALPATQMPDAVPPLAAPYVLN
jgi:polygalacturonase